MAQVISFLDYTPAPRFDTIPWTEVTIQEGTASVGPWADVETITFGTADPDPRYPMARSFTTELASDTLALWYRLIFSDATSDVEQPTLPIQNNPARSAYATVEELAVLLRVSPGGRWQALRRVIEAAAYEIDCELGKSESFATPPALVVEVNLERAVEHWQQMQSPFGIIGLGDVPAAYTARDTWDRHAHKLAPLKESWGLA